MIYVIFKLFFVLFFVIVFVLVDILKRVAKNIGPATVDATPNSGWRGPIKLEIYSWVACQVAYKGFSVKAFW